MTLEKSIPYTSRSPTKAGCWVASVALALFLGGCSGGSDNGSDKSATTGSSTPGAPPTTTTGFGACVAGFAGQRSTVTNHCTTCASTSSNNGNAVDGNRDTYAIDTYDPISSGSGAANSPTNGTAIIMATAQSGITFPAGEQAGAIVRFPGGIGTTATVMFSTLLAGTPQESFATDNGDTSGMTDQILLHKTTKAFDSVQAVFSVTAPDGMEKSIQIYEFCS